MLLYYWFLITRGLNNHNICLFIKDILNALQDLRYIPDWDPCVQGVSRVSIATGHDVISGTPVSMGTIEHAALKLMQMYGCDTNSVFSRLVL